MRSAIRPKVGAFPTALSGFGVVTGSVAALLELSVLSLLSSLDPSVVVFCFVSLLRVVVGFSVDVTVVGTVVGAAVLGVSVFSVTSSGTMWFALAPFRVRMRSLPLAETTMAEPPTPSPS